MSEVPSPSVPSGYQSASGSYIAQADRTSTAIIAVFHAALPPTVDSAEIAAAEALLATLPLDGLPERRGLPSPHVMPWPPNRFFVGREADLRTLARWLKEGSTAAIGQSPAITGMGGQGKTQLAVEFAYRYGQWFKGGVFWVNCSDPASMPVAVASCDTAFYPANAGISARPLPERTATVVSAWASDLPRLLIFDNCEDEAILDEWAPKSGGCRLLLTARRLSWSPARGIAAVPLGRLARPESLALLHHHRPDLGQDDPGLDAVADELGDLPLALDLAGNYLARYRDEAIGAPAAYLAELRAAGDILAHASLTVEDLQGAPGRSRSLTGHEKDVARTFEVSLCRLRPDDYVDALARELLARAAWLAPGVPIPRHILKLCADTTPNDAEASRRFADALARLLDLALIERTSEVGGAVVLHRLVAAFARSRIEYADAARHAIEVALGREAERLLAQHSPVPFQDWATHLLDVALAAGRDGTRASVELLASAGAYSSLVADYGLSRTMFQMAVEAAEAVYELYHPTFATLLKRLGDLQSTLNELPAALDTHSRVLDILKQSERYDSDSIEVAEAYGNLGNVHRKLGNLPAAEMSLTRALEIFQKANGYGPNHPEVARTLDNLAVVQRHLAVEQRSRGDLVLSFTTIVVALNNHKRAIRILEGLAEYGADHPEVGRFLTNLSKVQFALNDPQAALCSLTRALEIKEATFSPDHPEVGLTLANLAPVRQALGQLPEARENIARALTIFTSKLGVEHPHTVPARQLLASLEEELGRKGE